MLFEESSASKAVAGSIVQCIIVVERERVGGFAE